MKVFLKILLTLSCILISPAFSGDWREAYSPLKPHVRLAISKMKSLMPPPQVQFDRSKRYGKAHPEIYFPEIEGFNQIRIVNSNLLPQDISPQDISIQREKENLATAALYGCVLGFFKFDEGNGIYSFWAPVREIAMVNNSTTGSFGGLQSLYNRFYIKLRVKFQNFVLKVFLSKKKSLTFLVSSSVDYENLRTTLLNFRVANNLER